MAASAWSLDRLAETEYAQYATPGCCVELPYGTFVHDPRFPDRHDAHQIFRTRGSDLVALLQDADARFRACGLTDRKLTGHDPATRAALAALTSGDDIVEEALFLHAGPPRRPTSVSVTVTPMAPGSPEEQAAVGAAPRLARSPYHRASDARLGGEILIAHWEGVPAGITGWYAANGLARTRFVTTLPEFRGRGVASTLVRAVLERPGVRACEGLVLACGDPGLWPWYEQLGFARQGVFWNHRVPLRPA